MDYKYIAIIFLLVALIFLLVKEMNEMKNTIHNYYEKTKLMIGMSTKETEQKIRKGVDSCVERMKIINGDYMIQIRKMESWGKDQILSTNTNNYSDSDHEITDKKNKIPWLSQEEVISKKKEKSEVNRVISGSKQKECFKIDISGKNTVNSQKNNVESVKENNVINSVSQIEKSESKYDKNTEIKNKLKPKLSNSDKEVLNDEISNNEIINNVLLNGNEEDSSTNDSTSQEESYEYENSTSECDDEESENGVSVDLEEDNFSEGSSENSKSNKSKSITTSSSKKKKSKESEKNDMNEPNENNGDNNEDNNSLAESLVTTDVNLTLDNLQSVEKYNKKFLEKVAKRYNIPLFYKEGNKRVNYVKNELYEKIKEKLEQK